MYIAVGVFYAIVAVLLGGYLVATLTHVLLALVYLTPILLVAASLALLRAGHRSLRSLRRHDRHAIAPAVPAVMPGRHSPPVGGKE
jgi:hypothetical protein